nr:MAG TPA: hypothetical protein [Bacteriophage sp.]
MRQLFDTITLILILTVTIKVIDFRNLGALDFIIFALFIADVIVTIMQRRKPHEPKENSPR